MRSVMTFVFSSFIVFGCCIAKPASHSEPLNDKDPLVCEIWPRESIDAETMQKCPDLTIALYNRSRRPVLVLYMQKGPHGHPSPVGAYRLETLNGSNTKDSPYPSFVPSLPTHNQIIIPPCRSWTFMASIEADKPLTNVQVRAVFTGNWGWGDAIGRLASHPFIIRSSWIHLSEPR